jgi:hypothetical protein
MKLITLMLAVLFIAQIASADPITCETILPSGSTQASNGQIKITLRSNTFWDTAPGHHEYSPESLRVEAAEFALKKMPISLKKSTGLTRKDRAEQLQWALAFANRLQSLAQEGKVPPNTVELTLNPCEYDFSLLEAHQDTGSGDAQLLNLRPRLVVGRNNLTILGLAHPAALKYNAPPVIDCREPGRRCHGRVLMVVPRGLKGIKLLRLTFQGSHDSANFFVPEHYLHENHSALSDINKTRYGMLMIGYTTQHPSAVENLGNDVLVNGCVFKQVNLRAIELYGNARILGNRFEGALPPPTGTPSSGYMNSLSCFTNPNQSFCAPFAGRPNLYSASGGTLFGMNWHSAVSYRDFVAPPSTTVIENNTIQDFVEGVVGGHLPDGSDIRLNTFRRIADHGFYSLGSVRRARIESNIFERILGPSIKLGGDGKREDPLEEDRNTAAFDSSISFNHFRLIRSSAILMTGTSNRIEHNVHEALTDSSGWFNLDLYPLIWITTYGGNTSPSVCGYFNHAAYNRINRNESPCPNIFIQQLDDPPSDDPLWESCLICPHKELKGDRSIEGNQVLEGKQKVYVRARSTTRYNSQSNVQISGENVLMPGPYPFNGTACTRVHL